jgi:hypothetical protein
MIVRDFSFDIIDSTTNTYQPFDPRTDTLIMAPLDRYKIRVKDRYLVVIEPTQGTTPDNPDPNAFVIAFSTWTVGGIFSLNLFGQDFEQEGFAVGDGVFVFLHWSTGTPPYAGFLCDIIGINGSTATFRINTVGTGSGVPDVQAPLRAVITMVNDRVEIKPVFHFGNNSGPTSPLSAQPFSSPHADAIRGYISVAPNDLPPPLLYNLQKYTTLEPVIDSLGGSAYPLSFRRRAIIIEGTQFYAYRTNLDPRARTPTSLYALDGRIEVLLQAPVPIRDAVLTFPCLLLHPNRKGRTLNFLNPGRLTIASGTYTLTPPSGFSPIRSVLAVTGRDSDHPRLDIPDSLALTNPVTGASGAVPTITNRPGAEFVGVMIGQDGGEWVAVMTNKEPAVTPVPGPFQVSPYEGPIYRYDSLIGLLSGPDISAGVYIIQTLLKVGNTFVPIDEIEYNTTDVVTAPYPLTLNFATRTNIYPFLLSQRPGEPVNYDLYVSFSGIHFFIPVPSRRSPPAIASALTQPAGGYGFDLNNWVGGPITLKWRLFTPDGNIYDSNELTFPTIFQDDTMRFEPDNQLATISETATQIIASRTFNTTPNDKFYNTYIRAAIFTRPERYKPVIQTMFFIQEDYSTPTITRVYSEGHTSLIINRPPFGFRRYTITFDKTVLPPGQYTLHIRHSVRKIPETDWWSDPSAFSFIEDESYFYDFTISAPPEPPSGPPLAPDFCIPKIPAIAGENWVGLYQDANGNWQTFATTLTTCHLDNYCTCFELVSEVPSAYIDIIGYFRGSVLGKPVPSGAKHKARFIGQIKRIADQYESESFVSSAYAAEDIVRAYSERFEVELLIFDPCQLSHVDLLKFAERCDVVNRNNRLLPSELRDLKFEEVNIENDPKYARVRITLRRIKWRDEYRRNA